VRVERVARTSFLRRVATLIADNEFWLLWVYGAPLLLSSNLPLWLLAGALCAVPFFWLARRSARGSWSVAAPLDVPLALLLLLGLVGVAVSIDPLLSARLYAELFGGVALYFGLLNGLSETEIKKSGQRPISKRFTSALWILIALALVMGLVGALGLRFSEKFLPTQLYPYLPKLDFSIFNPRGFTPNLVAGAIAPVIPLCWFWGWRQSRWRRRALFGIALFLSLVVALTQSRGAIIGLGVSFAFGALWLKPRVGWIVVVLLIGAAALFGVAETNRLVDSSLLDNSTVTAAGRFELWQRALYIAQDFPFTGIGLGTFSQVVPVMYPLFINSPDAPLPHAHNMYLQMAVDYGVGGFVAFIGIVATMFALCIAVLRRTRGTPNELLAAGLVGGYLVFLVHGMLDAVAVSAKVSVVVWMLVAFLAVLYRSVLRDESYG